MVYYHRPLAEATYRVIPRDDSSFDVEVATAEADPALVKGFATALDAQAWITRQKERRRANPSAGRYARWSRPG